MFYDRTVAVATTLNNRSCNFLDFYNSASLQLPLHSHSHCSKALFRIWEIDHIFLKYFIIGTAVTISTEKCLKQKDQTSTCSYLAYALHVNIKCCFPLAEEWIKLKTVFSHTSGSLGASVCRGLGHMTCCSFHFSCCRSLCLASLPPTH